MADVTVKRLDEFEAIFNGGYRRVRAGLGVTLVRARGDGPPTRIRPSTRSTTTARDGQEEVYTVLVGKATLTVGKDDYELEAGVFARVGPQEARKITTGDEGARLVAIGAAPGKVYAPPEFTEEGTPTRC